MELAIVTGLAYLGYSLSRGGKEARPSERVVPILGPENAYPPPAPAGASLLAADRAAAQERWALTSDPRVTGVISPGTALRPVMPYVGRGRTATNEDMNQRKMEMFTGQLDADTSVTGTYRNKEEVASLFQPGESAQAVTSSGTSGNPTTYDTTISRLALTSVQNNVLPIAQVRVGPGLDVPVNVATGNDGFHPRYRAPQRDPGSMRAPVLPGTVAIGGAAVASEPRRDAELVPSGAGSLEVRFEHRPPLPSAASTTRESGARGSLLTRQPQGRKPDEERFGGPAKALGHVSRMQNTRDERSVAAGQVTNLRGSGVAAGAYSVASFDTSRMQRDNVFAGGVGPSKGPAAPASTSGHGAPTTVREFGDAAGGLLNARGVTSAGEMRPGDAPRATLHQPSDGVLINARGAVHAASLGAASADPARTARGELVQKSARFEPAGRMNALATLGRAEVRRRQSGASLPVPGYGVAPTTERVQPGQATSTFNKLPAHNVRALDMELGLETAQLETNELHVRL